MEKRIFFVSSKTEMREVLHNYNYVIVKFTAPWCGPCKRIKETFAELFENLPEEFVCVIINIDEGATLKRLMGIRSVPTFMNFINGESINTVVGADKKNLEKFFDNSLKKFNEDKQ